MARNGFRIFDADTHFRPGVAVLEPYLSDAVHTKLIQFEDYKARDKSGSVTYLMGARHYKRRLGAAANEVTTL